MKKEKSQHTIGIGNVTEDAYCRFGEYVDTKRHVAHVADGTKISYRRLIHAGLCYPKGKDIPSAELVGSVAKTHPHSLDGLHPLLNALTKGGARVLPNGEIIHIDGVFKGTGNFGFTSIWDKDPVSSEGAAFRYTKCRISDTYQEIFGDLLKEVPWIESPVGALEPEYLPIPLPLCLIMSESVTGLGVALKADYPNFSPQSLYLAYKNNDPMLLEPNINIGMDKNASQLKAIWETGQGMIRYYYYLDRVKTDDQKSEGVLISGDTGIFTISLRKFQKLIDEGKVVADNVSTQGNPRMLISRTPGARGVSIEDIEEICNKICYNDSTYTLNVTDGQSAFRIPLKEWIDITYKNYINLITKVNQKKIDQVMFDIKVQEALPLVVDYILNKNPKAEVKEISIKLGLTESVVSGVLLKPINYLRKNKDTSERIKSLKAKLKELKSFDPVKFTEEIIMKL